MTPPRCRELGRPLFVDALDELDGDRAEFDIELIEIFLEQVPLEFVFDSASDEAAQTAISDTGFDTLGQALLDADRPFRHSHA